MNYLSCHGDLKEQKKYFTKVLKRLSIYLFQKQVCHNNMYHLLTRVFFVINCLHIYMYSTKTILKKNKTVKDVKSLLYSLWFIDEHEMLS